MVGLLSCEAPPDPTAVPELAASEWIPTVYEVSWSTQQPGSAFVEYGRDYASSTPLTDSGRTDHQVVVLGLAASQAQSLRGVVLTDDGHRLETEAVVVQVPPPPPELGIFDAATLDPSRSSVAGAHLLFTLISDSGSWTVIMNSDGDYVWWNTQALDRVAVTAQIGHDGQSILWGEYDLEKNEDVGQIIRMRLDGSATSSTRALMSHHDFVEHRDGVLGWLNLDIRDAELNGETVRLASDGIYETPEGASEDTPPTSIFTFFDDYPGDPEVTCEHVGQSFDRYGEFDIQEWTHSNSLMFLPDRQKYYIMSRHTDTLLQVDRASGAVDWQMNGLHGDFTWPDGSEVWNGPEDAQLWSHGHMSHLWDGGMVVFDNGDHHTPKVSGVAEYAWDEITQTVELVWRHTDPEGRFTSMMGDARKLPNGNYLVAWSALGTIEELTPDHEVVWRANGGVGLVVGRVRWLEDLYELPAP